MTHHLSLIGQKNAHKWNLRRFHGDIAPWLIHLPRPFFLNARLEPKIKVWCTAIWYAHIYSFWVFHCWNLSNWKQKIDSWAVCQPTTHCHACINCWKLEQNMSCALPSSTHEYVACILHKYEPCISNLDNIHMLLVHLTRSTWWCINSKRLQQWKQCCPF